MTSVSNWEVQALKGLPLPKVESIPGWEEKSEVWKELITTFDKGVDDAFLLRAHQIYQALKAGEQGFGGGDCDRPEVLLLIAAKLIRFFVQLNSTGPSIQDGEVSQRALQIFEEMDLREELNLDGFEISEHSVLPQALIVAKEFLREASMVEEFWVGHFHAWWALRVCFLLQRILDGRSPQLAGMIGATAAALSSKFEDYDDPDLKVLFLCELSDIHLYYYDLNSAKKCLNEAGECCGAQFYTTGILGKRTRFQQKDLPQLVVRANVKETIETEGNTIYLKEFRSCRALMDVPLDDDTRLEKVKLNDENECLPQKLTTIQQIVLLGELNYMKKSGPKDVLLKEEILAYVRGLLEDPSLWCVFVVGLLFRSMTETDHIRTVERSMMQFENIQKAVKLERSPSMGARYQFYHASCMPLTWEIETALAEVLMSLGQVKSALDIYLRLNSWEEVIACYHFLELKHKAEEVIRDQIQKIGETPKLLVYLGDATNDISYYDKAWELSEQKNFLSRQRLGVYWFKNQEYEKSIPFLKSAVELNPLEFPVWVRLAYAALHSENWELAVKAYVHANALDDETFENWNNLAKANLKLGNKEGALRALKQATKCNFEEWKVWENLMVVALQCTDLEWTVTAFNRLLDLKGSYMDDVVLKLLVDMVSDDGWDKTGEKSGRTKDSVLKLCGRITAKVTTNSEAWQSYSTLLYSIVRNGADQEDKWYNMVQFQQKAVRCRIQERNWEKVPESVEKTVESVELLCQRTQSYLKALPDSPSGKDLKVQAEYLAKQVSNSVERRMKEVLDPSIISVYSNFSSCIKNSLDCLTS